MSLRGLSLLSGEGPGPGVAQAARLTRWLPAAPAGLSAWLSGTCVVFLSAPVPLPSAPWGVGVPVAWWELRERVPVAEVLDC